MPAVSVLRTRQQVSTNFVSKNYRSNLRHGRKSKLPSQERKFYRADNVAVEIFMSSLALKLENRHKNFFFVCFPKLISECLHFFSDLAAHSDSHKDADSKTVRIFFTFYFSNSILNIDSFRKVYCLADKNALIGDFLSSQDGKGGSMACTECPYVANSSYQLTYHSRRHNQPDSPHKCYKCSYGAPNNVILALHVRLHGRHNSSYQSSAAASVNSTPKRRQTSKTPSISARLTRLPCQKCLRSGSRRQIGWSRCTNVASARM